MSWKLEVRSGETEDGRQKAEEKLKYAVLN